MIDQINELAEDGLKSSPETSRYTENKWVSRKNQNELYWWNAFAVKKLISCSHIESSSMINEAFSELIMRKFWQNTSREATELPLKDFVFQLMYTKFSNLLLQ